MGNDPLKDQEPPRTYVPVTNLDTPPAEAVPVTVVPVEGDDAPPQVQVNTEGGDVIVEQQPPADTEE
jgi:hypothetical protein